MLERPWFVDVTQGGGGSKILQYPPPMDVRVRAPLNGPVTKTFRLWAAASRKESLAIDIGTGT